MTNQELIDHYVNLLIFQYASKTKAKAMVEAFVREAVADQIFGQVGDGFDLETAVGAQLDLIRLYKNVPRNLYGIDITRSYFGMPTYDDANPDDYVGFAEYADDDPWWYFMTYPDVERLVYTLTDEEVRRFIKYAASLMACDFSMKAIDDIFWEHFGATVTMTDNEDMTMDIHHDIPDADNLFKIIYFAGMLPHPAGVGLTVTES